jgi:hypothetical protein
MEHRSKDVPERSSRESVEADEAGEDAGVRVVHVHEDLLRDVVGVGARVIVVVLAQLRRRAVEAQR